ncbi:MAG: nitrate reductase molybdenum cofactor assembly chaperone [Gammaproteobacteria bacterium]|jgi:nitrate reductase delta subunit|nr:nitrate reductase molybdenum cofactor assembly chaperone [Gammaproteobacteria bacterium]MBT3488442.1 nitrate reductase molybdenum cofactor assembly chaperone [Gammaproteobacteria bacterium]MBT3718251.1 nitrate reductase molybdenum cofactor assembly chaperone [Gammaproteobacteria bacterium]MBT3846111.1 nitrate reductase molybdenum cofactor assembly chaperone [Gammaproteobacteria bacterium]MBT3893712.1 nitrate reductase molybdenum cofactor assembly chaperone [Gammaproteobacteria bacterium]
MKLYTVLARLLDYPTPDLMNHLSEIREVMDSEPQVEPSEREVVSEFMSWIQLHELTGIQQIYVQTFDMVPEHDLHMTHHIHGDNRDRGPALIDLSEHFRANGLEIKDGEIPDYLPLLLEYVSTLGEDESRFFLADVGKILSILADNLEKADSPYARLIRLVENRGQLVKAA